MYFEMQSTFKMKNKEVKIIRRLIAFFILALFLSGLTAIPIDVELSCSITNFSFGQFYALLAAKGFSGLHPCQWAISIFALRLRLACLCTFCTGRSFYWSIQRSGKEYLGNRIWNDSMCL